MKNNSNHTYDSVNLYEWVTTHYTEDEMRSIFINVDKALKYIHEHDYCIEVFHPTEINVLNNEDDYIQFKKLMKLPANYEEKKDMIREDIFNSAFIQIALYSNCLKYLKPEFLKENFDSFVQFIPQDDVPYYRGVIQRGASVYYCEYALEKQKRQLADLENELGEKASVTDLTPNTNKKINDVIYRQINGLRDAAFANLVIIPVIILTILMIITVIVLTIQLFV